jgi:hypothetical protein
VKFTGTGKWRITKISLGVENKPLFSCLQSHLSEHIWQLYRDWKILFWLVLQERLQYQITRGNFPDKTYTDLLIFDENGVKIYRTQVKAAKSLIKALSLTRHRGVFEGRCDACP